MTTVTRRHVLKSGTALVGGMAGILATGRAPAFAQGATVHWLRWTDFVPASDQLLRNEVAKDGENGQSLLVFDPADGHTVNSYPLPQATGWPVGVSVGHDRRVVTATSDGQVYGFVPE